MTCVRVRAAARILTRTWTQVRHRGGPIASLNTRPTPIASVMATLDTPPFKQQWDQMYALNRLVKAEPRVHDGLYNKRIKILHEDDQLLVVDKPPFLPVGPSKFWTLSADQDTIITALRRQRKTTAEDIGKAETLYPVQELDPEITGVLLIAKNCQARLSYQLALRGHFNMLTTKGQTARRAKWRSLPKRHNQLFTAVVWGTSNKSHGFLAYPLMVDRERKPMLRIDFKRATECSTEWKNLRTDNKLMRVQLRPEGFRPAQLRAHMYSVGWPIVGDHMYGYRPALELSPNRLLLHSTSVTLWHPQENEEVTYSCDVPF